jgi:hypothetical protein
VLTGTTVAYILFRRCTGIDPLTTGGKGERRKEMIFEGGWVIVVAAIAFAAIVIIVLLISGELYDPDRSHE